jgi:AcrR family transcriptional regulator
VALQRQRLLRAAALEFAENGYAGASSESTFYEHFTNTEDCILALFGRASEVLAESMASAVAAAAGADAIGRLQVAIRAFLAAIVQYPEFAQTLLVEIIGAGPRAARRRDEVVQGFADALDAENARAARRGLGPRFASPHDAYAIVGAVTELISRQVRLGEPEDVTELAPVVDRLIAGVLASGAS